MDGYPTEFVTHHEAPLLIVSGLGSTEKYSELPLYPLLENGPLVTCELPPVDTPAADHVLDLFLQHDSTAAWAGRQERGLKRASPVFRIRAVGREYRLPPRKANPPSPGNPGSPTEGLPTRTLHSPISPLSPDSPLYPDGVVSHIWLRKHQSLLPAIFVSFFELYTETSDSNLQNIKDNELVAAINSTKKHFTASSHGPLSSASIGGDEFRSSGNRTKFVAVILSEGSVLSSPQIDERLSFIKRNTNLITNATFFFLPAKASAVELQHFVSSLLVTLNSGAIEYYREMSKHTRRKRNKGSIPPPTIPTSRALSSQAWILRYEFKLGIFAEFRQEMDVAGKNYETAYEKLLTEVFETTSSWNERWKEARLLADVLSLRMIRCQLWEENYTGAKRRWSYHVSRMREMLDRRGRGIETYGWAAWMSRWNKCLAEMLQLANLPVFAVPVPLPRSSILPSDIVEQEPSVMFAPPEKTIPLGENLTSEDYLHHPGFYYLKAADWISERKSRADRISPDDADIHDTYLCPDPREESALDHASLQMSLLALARREFDVRQQKRMSDSVTYQLAMLKMSKAPTHSDFWGDALKDLRTIASTYRREGWWKVLEDVLWRIVECGRRSGDGGSSVVAELELMCGGVFRQRKNWDYHLGRCLRGLDTIKVKPTMVVRAADVVNMLSVSYAFESRKAHVGEAVTSQLVISSNAQPSSKPLLLSEVKITYEGNLRTVLLRHNPAATASGATGGVHIMDLKGKIYEQDHSPEEPPPSPTSPKSYLIGEADFSLAPGHTKIYELSTVLREAGDVKAVCATLGIVSDEFELDIICVLDEDDKEASGSVHPLPFKKPTTPNGGNGIWWVNSGDGVLKKKPIRAAQPGSLHVLPRPPKMEVFINGLDMGIYIDEIVKIGLEIVNGEDEDANVGVGIKILGWPEEDLPGITWISPDGSKTPETPSLHSLGDLKPSDRVSHSFSFQSSSVPADCAVEIKLRYHLLSDPETPIEKIIVADMPIITPFHPTFDFSPRIHPDRWPDYFSLDQNILIDRDINITQKKRADGIIQRWCLTAAILGVAEEKLIIETCELLVLHVDGAADCIVVSSSEDASRVLEPTKSLKTPFTLDVQKHALEDRSPSTIDISLVVRWRRNADSLITSTTLPVPRLFVPLREPRVLAASKLSVLLPDVLELLYTIENPTTYFLTFNILMEPNDSFAFSGSKQTSLQLLPMSRVTLPYRIYPFVHGVWIHPVLRVVDRYFSKSLGVAPGGEGTGHDKGGLMVWVPSGDQEENTD